jgi:spheroidene monooxygenase
MNRPQALSWRAGTEPGGEPSAPASNRGQALHDPPASQHPCPPGHAVLLMSRLRADALPWALWRLARGARAVGTVPGMRFARVLGSGRNGGFGLEPGLDCQGVFAAFDTADTAEDFALRSAAAQAYRERAVEHFSLTLQATSSRGSWGGQAMAPSAEPPPQGPVAALTRAAIKPSRMREFWRHSPPAEAELAAAPGCRLAVGLGEAPLLRQATFSLWDSTQAMDAYARRGAHQRAIRASWGGEYFSEWMFVRFRPLALRGRWHGRDFDTGSTLG